MRDERSYCGPNGPNLQTVYGPDSYFLGPDQLSWLKRALLNSRATWKVIASDMPLSLIVYDDAANRKGSEAFAQGDGAAANSKSPICCASSRPQASPTPCGCRRMCTTRPRITTIPTRRNSRISSRSGNPPPDRCRPEPL